MSQYSLSVLGLVRLTGPDGTSIQSVLHQPKRAAMLAFLALAPGGTRARSELLELFWPNSTDDDARHALSQALYYLRRSLGPTAIAVEGDLVRLNADVVATDVQSFRAFVTAGRLEEAMALYTGDLLDQAPSIPGFDYWLDGARETLRQQALNALLLLSTQAQASSDHDAAIRWAEQGHSLAPLREAPVRRLLTALVAAGQPVRAREVLDRYAARLRDEMETQPSPETVAILDRRPEAAAAPSASSAPTPVGMSVEPVRAEPIRELARVAGSNSVPAAVSGARDVPAPAAFAINVAGRWRGFRRAMLPAAAFALLLTGAFVDRIGVFGFRRDAVGASSTNRIGIFPFLYRGHPELAYLGEGIPELLGISIQSLDQISVVDPRALAAGAFDDGSLRIQEAASRARELGAAHFVIGSVVEAGSQIHVTARLHRSDGSLVAIVSDRARDETKVFELVDDLVRQLIGSAFPGTTDLERSAAHTTRSLPALRHFLTGERLFRSGHYQDAVVAFGAAVEEDSVFALAHYRDAIASLWSGNADFNRAHIKAANALKLRDGVSALERDLFLALDEFLRGRLLPAERLYESVLVRQPENIEAWFQLAEARFHYGGLHGRSVAASEDAWRRVLTINPGHHAALIHLSALAARRRDPVLDSLDLRLNGAGDSAISTPQVRALRVFASGTETEKAQFITELARYPRSAVSSTAAYVSRYLGDLEAATRIAQVLTEPTRADAERAAGHLLAAHFAIARGRLDAARKELAFATRIDAAQAEMHRLLLATIPPVQIELRHQGGAVASLALAVVPRLQTIELSDFDGTAASGLRSYARALAYHQAGGEDGALLIAARRLAEPPRNPRDSTLLHALGRGLVAERYRALGNSAAARAELEQAINGVEQWYEHLRSDYLRALARERFIIAEIDIDAGRDSAAESMLVPIGENSVAELPYLGASLIRIGEIRERAGDEAAAAAAYRRALDLWSHADSELDPIQAELHSRLTAMGR